MPEIVNIDVSEHFVRQPIRFKNKSGGLQFLLCVCDYHIESAVQGVATKMKFCVLKVGSSGKKAQHHQIHFNIPLYAIQISSIPFQNRGFGPQLSRAEN